MLISTAFAYKTYIIILFNAAFFIVLLCLSLYIFFSAKKTALSFSYITIMSMIMLWLLAKVFKSASPNVELRWVFVVIQYIGVEFLGYFLIIFAYIYTKNQLPTRRLLLLLAITPTLSYLIVITNPLHMLFFSTFDFYYQNHGILFYILQVNKYAYWIVAAVLLAIGFIRQPQEELKNLTGFFALISVIPLVANVYFTAFNMFDSMPWIFPFPEFDITPVAAGLAISLFMIPALKHRFLDIIPASYSRLFAEMPYGIVFIDRRDRIYAYNAAFKEMFKSAADSRDPKDIYEQAIEENESGIHMVDILPFSQTKSNINTIQIEGMVYMVNNKELKKGVKLKIFTNITQLAVNQRELLAKEQELDATNKRLEVLENISKELVATKTKTSIAQNVHDILGHSLTVVIGIASLAATDENVRSIDKKVEQISKLLTSSLNDLKHAILGKTIDIRQNDLTNAISYLDNENIEVNLETVGSAYELQAEQSEAVFRLCQEAVTNAIKHGKAKRMNIILRYKTEEIEIFALDNGNGCKEIIQGFGLTGIEIRFIELGGQVKFRSNEENGFSIHARIPRALNLFI